MVATSSQIEHYSHLKEASKVLPQFLTLSTEITLSVQMKVNRTVMYSLHSMSVHSLAGEK